MYSQGAQVYQRTQQTTASPRELEASLLVKSAARMQAIRDDWGQLKGDLDAAITYNRKLWTILSAAATDETSQLPDQLKSSIASLAVFIFTRTLELLTSPSPEKMTVLIQINASIAAGLRGSPG